MLLVAGVMLAYDWVLGTRRVRDRRAAGVRAALRATAPRAGVREGPRAQRRDDVGDHRGRRRVGDDQGLRRRRHLRLQSGPGDRRAGQRPGQGRNPRRAPVPVRRAVLRAHRVWSDPRRRRPRPGERADGRGDDRLHVPDVPVPRADRRVHRGARPDPDRGRRAAARARRARPADRSAAHRPPRSAAGRDARRAGPRRHVRLPDARRHDVARRGGAAQRRRDDPQRPAGGDGRLDGIGQDHARAVDRPLRRPDRRRAVPRWCAAAMHRQRRAARAARRGVAGAVHVRRHDRRQRRVRQARHVAARDRGCREAARARRLDQLRSARA